MLNPNRFRASSLRRTKTVKWELAKRLPARYTVSKSPRRTSRASRGNPWPSPGRSPLFRREAMTSLLAAVRKHFAPALGLHARAEPVRLRAPASPRLKRTLWQDNPPLVRERLWSFHTPALGPPPWRSVLNYVPGWLGISFVKPTASSRQRSELSSVLSPSNHRQQTPGVAYGQGKSDTPPIALCLLPRAVFLFAIRPAFDSVAHSTFCAIMSTRV